MIARKSAPETLGLYWLISSNFEPLHNIEIFIRRQRVQVTKHANADLNNIYKFHDIQKILKRSRALTDNPNTQTFYNFLGKTLKLIHSYTVQTFL